MCINILMTRHISVPFAVIIANLCGYNAQIIPVGEYCKRVEGNYVSKLVSSPSGTASVSLAGDIASVTFLYSHYSVGNPTGLIAFDAMNGVNGDTFPFISHQWSMYYDESAGIVKLTNFRLLIEMGFNRQECVRQTSELVQPGSVRKTSGEGPESPKVSPQKYCSDPKEVGPDASVIYNFRDGYPTKYNAEFKKGSVTVSLHDVIYKLKNSTDRDVYWVSSDSTTRWSVLEYPYLGYRLSIQYHAEEKQLKAIRNIHGSGERWELSPKYC